MKKNTFFLPFVCLSFTGMYAQDKIQQRPNIIFILADDFGCTDLQCTGSRYYESPHIDRIAQKGINFTQGHAACQVSSPSRASILTGKFTARHGITNWIGEATGEQIGRASCRERV